MARTVLRGKEQKKRKRHWLNYLISIAFSTTVFIVFYFLGLVENSFVIFYSRIQCDQRRRRTRRFRHRTERWRWKSFESTDESKSYRINDFIFHFLFHREVRHDQKENFDQPRKYSIRTILKITEQVSMEFDLKNFEHKNFTISKRLWMIKLEWKSSSNIDRSLNFV